MMEGCGRGRMLLHKSLGACFDRAFHGSSRWTELHSLFND